METNTTNTTTTFSTRLSRLEASNLLRKEILTWLRLTLEWIDTGRQGSPPQLCMKAEAGSGKTVITLEELAIVLSEFPELRILYAVPSVELGLELETKAVEKYGITNTRLLLGRGQKQPGSEKTMCVKSDIANTLSALSISVSENLCSKKMDDGTVSECQFAASCPYLKQMQEAKRGGLIIASHQYLSVKMEPLKDIDAIIVDESFTQVLCADRRIDLGRFTSFRSTGTGFRGKKQQLEEADIEMGQAVESFRAIIETAEKEDRQPTLDDFRAQGFTSEHCRYLTGLEYSRIMQLDIEPGMSAEQQRDILAEAQVQEAFAFARVWKILTAELATERTGEPHGLVIERGILNPKSRELGNYIHAFWSRDPIFQDTPALIIDADADPVIMKRFFPAARFVEIAAKWQNVEIIQAWDKTGSAQCMKGNRRRDEAYNAAIDAADRLADLIEAGDTKEERLRRRPLLVAQKSVIDAYREAGELKDAPFDVGHFGNIRGKDNWKNAAAVIVAGRIQPSVEQIEALARSIWFASDEPLTFLKPDEQGRLILPNCQHWTTPKQGEAREIAVSYHPDPRADRVLRQVREAELMQAIARIRPVHRSAEIPCQVIVLSNIPLPIEVDRLATWAEIVPDRFDMARLNGFVPEIAQDMADAYPGLFKSKNAVWSAASRRPDRAFGAAEGALQNPYIYQKGNARGWVLVSFQRDFETGTRAGKAWVQLIQGDNSASVIARAAHYLPDAYQFDVQMPEPRREAASKPETRDQATGIRYIKPEMIVLSRQFADQKPWWTYKQKYRRTLINKNSMTYRRPATTISSSVRT